MHIAQKENVKHIIIDKYVLRWYSHFSTYFFLIIEKTFSERGIMSVTIKDVAREADVSVATVSRVVNGMPNINDEMKLRVRAAIKKLGYKPNQLAKGLKNSVTKTIGLIA